MPEIAIEMVMEYLQLMNSNFVLILNLKGAVRGIFRCHQFNQAVETGVPSGNL